MNEEQILNQIREEISRRKQRPLDTIPQDAELIRELGLDSLDYAAVVIGVEAAIGGELDEGAVDWAAVRTVRQLAVALQQNVR